MSYDYDPASDGLTYLGSLDFEAGSYEWDTITAYVRPEDKAFFWEDGSGCSCNGPMEFIYKLSDFDTGTYEDFLELVLNRTRDELKSTYNTPAGKSNIVDEMAALLKEAVKYA